eukprot:scaffold1375_cov96-Isochrysis_galbana.AAC.3
MHSCAHARIHFCFRASDPSSSSVHRPCRGPAVPAAAVSVRPFSGFRRSFRLLVLPPAQLGGSTADPAQKGPLRVLGRLVPAEYVAVEHPRRPVVRLPAKGQRSANGGVCQPERIGAVLAAKLQPEVFGHQHHAGQRARGRVGGERALHRELGL